MPGLLLKELSRYPIGTFADIIYRDSLLYQSRVGVCLWEPENHLLRIQLQGESVDPRLA